MPEKVEVETVAAAVHFEGPVQDGEQSKINVTGGMRCRQIR